MQVNPIEFLTKIKQCTDEGVNKTVLTDWFNFASLLSLQTQGCAVSEGLIKQLQSLFSATFKAVANLDDVPENKKNSQWLFNQISEYYQWLNTISGYSNEQILERWLCWSPNEVSNAHNSTTSQLDCFETEIAVTEIEQPETVEAPDVKKCQPKTTSSNKYNRFD